MSWFKKGKKDKIPEASNKSIAATVVLNDETGLHVRPASLFAKKAMEFVSSVHIEMNGRKVNAKSIMEILTLGAASGTRLTIIAQGEDAEKAIETLTGFVERGFEDAEE